MLRNAIESREKGASDFQQLVHYDRIDHMVILVQGVEIMQHLLHF
jgi:hypothetical protein